VCLASSALAAARAKVSGQCPGFKLLVVFACGWWARAVGFPWRPVPHNNSFKPSPHRYGNERTVSRAGRLNSDVRHY
jgi:hypothetical protein